MRLWRHIGRQRWAKVTIGVAAAEYLRFVGMTTRFTLEPADIYARGEADMPIILAFWHGQHLLAPVARKGTHRVNMLVSRHRDGEINAIAAKRLGVGTIRGSGNHGGGFVHKAGVAAFQSMLDAARRRQFDRDFGRRAESGARRRPRHHQAGAGFRPTDLSERDRHQPARRAQQLGSHHDQSAVRPRRRRRRRAAERSGRRRRRRARSRAPHCSKTGSMRRRGAPMSWSTSRRRSVSVPERLPFALRLISWRPPPGRRSRRKCWRGVSSAARNIPSGSPNGAAKPRLKRPQGPLIWVHGASVGEMLAAVPLIERLRAQDFAVLVTSGTVTFGGARRAAPAGRRVASVHSARCAALSCGASSTIGGPDLALFVESDLWPNLILSCAERRIPMIVINGRLSERSFAAGSACRGVIAALLSRFDLCLTQSAADAERYAQLGAPRVTSTGNLKLDVPAPPVDQAALQRLKEISRHAAGRRRGFDASRRGERDHRRASAIAREISVAVDGDRAAPSRARRKHRRQSPKSRGLAWRCARDAGSRCPISASMSPTRWASSV